MITKIRLFKHGPFFFQWGRTEGYYYYGTRIGMNIIIFFTTAPPNMDTLRRACIDIKKMAILNVSVACSSRKTTLLPWIEAEHSFS